MSTAEQEVNPPFIYCTRDKSGRTIFSVNLINALTVHLETPAAPICTGNIRILHIEPITAIRTPALLLLLLEIIDRNQLDFPACITLTLIEPFSTFPDDLLPIGRAPLPMPVRRRRRRVDIPPSKLGFPLALLLRVERVRIGAQARDVGVALSDARKRAVVVPRIVAEPLEGDFHVLVPEIEAVREAVAAGKD